MASLRRPANELDPAGIVGTNLIIIDRTAESAGRRARLSEDETFELIAEVRARFAEDDYRVIRAWSKKSSLRTYLVTCSLRFALDIMRDQGYYTVTAEALLRGPIAVLLDQLRAEGLSPAQAAAVVRERYGAEETDEELVELADSLAAGLPLARNPLVKSGSEKQLIARLNREAQNHEISIAEALSSLPAEDQLLIVWRYWEGLPASEIGRRLSIGQRPIYRRLESLRNKLHRSLTKANVSVEASMALLAWSGWSIEQLVGDQEPSREVVSLAQEISVEIIRQFRDKPESLHELHPRLFEELVAELLASYGWRVELTPATRDGGYDLFAISRDAAGVETSWIVECKRYRKDRPVGIEVVRALYAVKHDLGAANVLLATTSRFSRDVHAYKASHYDLQLRDYEGIVDWINRYRPHPNGSLYVRDQRLVVPKGLSCSPPLVSK